jgi:cobalamin-dependent methionine synthase I
MEAYLRGAMTELQNVIKNQYGVSKLSSMNPGSLAGWPIDRQRELFDLLDNKNEEIGVELTESFLMLPNKSGSGILFKSKTGYSNCKLCERLNCPTRRDPFDSKLKAKLIGE